MMRSLFSGVTGLTSHQTRMDVIGNNIANVNTYGFKSSRVTFRDIYYQNSISAAAGTDVKGGINPSQIGYGTKIGSIDKIMSQSAFAQTSRTLDVAIAGENGFFQVQDASGNKYYTRAGNFYVVDDRLVDANGNFVLGTMNQDPKISAGMSNVGGSGDMSVQVPDVHIASTSVSSTGVAAWNFANAASAASIAGIPTVDINFSKGNQPRDMNVTFTIIKDMDTTGGATIPNIDKAEYTIGNLTTPDVLEFKITEKTLATLGTPEKLQNYINSMLEDAKQMAKDEKEEADPDFLQFEAGKITISYDMTNLSDVTTGGPMTSKQTADAKQALVLAIIGKGDSTAAANATNTINLESSSKEQHYEDLLSFSVGNDGVMTGNHPVHGLLTFGRIDIVTFNNSEGLQEAGGSYFTSSVASGDPKVKAPGLGGAAELQSQALEMSNVNLSGEMSDMIITQRGFQANSRIITVSDTMLEELINLKR